MEKFLNTPSPLPSPRPMAREGETGSPSLQEGVRGSFPKLAVIYLSYHSEPYLERLIVSLHHTTYPFDQLELIIVDNLHPEFGSSEKILREKIEVLSGKRFPRVTILPQKRNLGFSGGMNIGITKAIELGCKYVYLHNQDGFTDSKAFEKIVEVMERDSSIGAAQSLMMLYPETELINSSGNNFHYLGFGYVKDFGKRVAEDFASSSQTPPDPPDVWSGQALLTVEEGEPITFAKREMSSPSLQEGDRGSCIKDIGYASGAAVLLRVDLLEKYGLWDEDYFFYHEDLEYSLRLRVLGYRVVIAKDSIFYHHYEFSRNKNKFYFMERNRFGLLLTYYKIPTLLLLLPINLVIDLGIVCFAVMQGWGKEKMRAYFYWGNPHHWKLWLSKRERIQAWRVEKDRVVLKQAVSEIYFPEAGLDNPLLKYIANPLMKIYFLLVKKIVTW